MKQLLLFLFALLPLAASADSSGTCGTNLTWTYVDATHTLTISGEGSMANYSSNTMPWYPYRTEMTKAVIEDRVTSIGRYAFYGCSGLTSITIPNSVTIIGLGAFCWCSGLISVTIPNSVTTIGDYVFQDCGGLTSVNIPNSVTGIGLGAFYGCSGLTSLTIPNSVISIGNSAFSYCSSLSTLTIPNSVISIGNSAFSYCSSLSTINIPNSVTTVGMSAFANCSGLTSVIIPNSVTTIEKNAFSGCSGLTSLTIPNSVASIGEYAFDGCCNLISINVDIDNSFYDSRNNCNAIIETASNTLIKGCQNTVIPNSVTTLRWYAFRDCSGLTSITIPNSVTTIGNGTFSGCSGLTSISIPNSVTNIRSSAFQDCSSLTSINVDPNNSVYDSRNNCNAIIETALNTLIKGCQNTEIPNSVTSIGKYAFSGCNGLTSIAIPNSVTSIEDYAFWGCSGLTSITIGNSVTTIGMSAFSGCSGLTSITIPNSVTSIGDYAFWGCIGLRSLTFNCKQIGDWFSDKVKQNITDIVIDDNVTSIGSNAFNGCYSLTAITIPNSVTSIGDGAFRNCSSLTSITIPNNVTYIGSYAFYCDNLQTVNSEITEPFNCSGAFSENTLRKGTLYVPAGTKDLYTRFDGWREFLKIEEVGGAPEESVWLTLKDSQGASKLKLKKGVEQELAITPEEGWKLLTVTMDGTDVTAQVKNGNSFTTPAIMQDAVITIVYEQEVPSEVAGARQSKTKVKVVDDGVIISNAEPDTRCVVYQSNGQQVTSVIVDGDSRKITLQKGQMYILTIGDRTLKFAL